MLGQYPLVQSILDAVVTEVQLEGDCSHLCDAQVGAVGDRPGDPGGIDVPEVADLVAAVEYEQSSKELQSLAPQSATTVLPSEIRTSLSATLDELVDSVNSFRAATIYPRTTKCVHGCSGAEGR